MKNTLCLSSINFSLPASVMQLARSCSTAPSAKHITTTLKDDVLLVKFDSPGSKVNSLGTQVMTGESDKNNIFKHTKIILMTQNSRAS